MCRIAAYSGPSRPLEDIIVRPSHSLLTQSQHAEEAKLAVNGDGFGVSWYREADAIPGVYRDVMPAWSDSNLTSLSRMVSSHLFIAHVRASTTGATSRENCHPFAFSNWSFSHNGQVPHINRIRRDLEAALPDDLYNARRGTTDSELIFLTLLRHGLAYDVDRAWAATLADFKPNVGEKPVRMTCVFSDGTTLFAMRYASDNKCPTLYLSDWEGGRLLASEPLGGDTKTWKAVMPNRVLRISAAGLVES